MCLLGQFISKFRQEPSFGPWKVSHFLQQKRGASCTRQGEVIGYDGNFLRDQRWLLTRRD